MRASRKTLDALTRPLWPVHLKPLPDELLSSWFVRLAHAHGLKVQTFARLQFGSVRQLWNRDIDRLAPDWLIDTFCRHTATPDAIAKNCTLRAYEGLLYRELRETYVTRWILPLRMFHRTWRGYGLQFCPHCLAEDTEPYFRKRWRVAFYTCCTRHQVMLHDRCPCCFAPVAFHRRELGRPTKSDGGLFTECHRCDFDLRHSVVRPMEFYDEDTFREYQLEVRRLEGFDSDIRPPNFEYYNVLHQLCYLIGARYRNVKLLEYCRQKIGADKRAISPGRVSFESRFIEERHHLTQAAFWYMANLEARLTDAWNDGAVTYSALRRGFEEDRPEWFDLIVGRFVDWRARKA